MFMYLSCKEKEAINLRDSKRVGGGRNEKRRNYIYYTFNKMIKGVRISATIVHFIHVRNWQRTHLRIIMIMIIIMMMRIRMNVPVKTSIYCLKDT